ncbi:MAG: SgcJ/EcaC family oxidoreductase [Nostocaceae cyanobacterium]|nr:SgcJ/EcaC family oxidoreductase [Nostocaceae cyanobacterium]
MTPEEIRAIIQQAAKAWMTGDPDGFAKLFAPDGVFIVPGNRWVGETKIRQVAADFAATHTDVKIEIQQIVIDGNHAVVEWLWSDTETATGLNQKAEDAIVVDFKDGLISRWREYIDTETSKNKN